MMRWNIIGCPCTQNILRYRRYPYCAKLSNKERAKVICRFSKLRTAHNKRQKSMLKLIVCPRI